MTNIRIYCHYAAQALNLLAKEIGLGNMAIRWQGSDPEQWVVKDNTDIRAIHHGRVVANVNLTPTDNAFIAALAVNDCRDIIRDDHVVDFDPSLYGITPNNKYDIFGNKEHDLVATNIPLEQVPNHIIQTPPPIRNQGRRRFKVSKH